MEEYGGVLLIPEGFKGWVSYIGEGGTKSLGWTSYAWLVPLDGDNDQ